MNGAHNGWVIQLLRFIYLMATGHTTRVEMRNVLMYFFMVAITSPSMICM